MSRAAALAVPFGLLIIGAELALGVMLAKAGWDRRALRLGVVLHLGVVALLGLSGQNYDPNVWTWNISQAVLLVLLLHKEALRPRCASSLRRASPNPCARCADAALAGSACRSAGAGEHQPGRCTQAITTSGSWRRSTAPQAPRSIERSCPFRHD